MKRPAFQFYPGDWRKDVELRSCSVAARGLWIDLLCIAHECEPYGHLVLNGKPMTAAKIAGQIGGITAAQTQRLIDELLDNGVARQLEDGTLYSKRMVEDERVRNARAEGGKSGAEHGAKGKDYGSLGGRGGEFDGPGLLYAVQRLSGGPIKVGITRHLKQRMSSLRGKLGEPIVVLGVSNVPDMSAAERYMLDHFEGRRDGEWISAEWGVVRDALASGPHPPFEPPPSSSSSSSASALNTATPDGVAGARPPDEAPPQLPLIEGGAKPAAGPYTPPDCPHIAVLALWAEELPAMPQHESEHWRGSRADHLRARWRETAVSKRWPDRDTGLAYMRKLFRYVGQSEFLTGRAKAQQGRRPFRIELEWLVEPTNWARVIEGKYHEEVTA